MFLLGLQIGYALVLISVAYTDLRERRIPNKIIVPALGVALVAMFYIPGWQSALIGAAVASFVFILPVISFGKQGGMGDVKLAAFIGLILGWPVTFTALVIAILLAAAVALIGVLIGKWNRKSLIPFGPFLSLGALICLFVWS